MLRAMTQGSLHAPLRGSLGIGDATEGLALDWRFQATMTLPAGLTVTRASAGWYRDSAGTWTQAAVDAARLHHDSSGNPLGLLLEPARTNHYLNSATPATQGLTLAAGSYTVWVEGSGSLDLTGGAGSDAAGKSATAAAKQRVTVSARPAWAAVTAKSVGDYVVPTTANNHAYECTTAGSTGAAEPTWPTDGTTVSDGTAVWTDRGLIAITATVTGTLNRVQVEDGPTQTSYIDTGASAVTRSRDVAFRTLGSEWNGVEGTLVVEWRADLDPGDLAAAVSLDDGDNNDRITLWAQGGGDTIAGFVVSAGTTQADLGHTGGSDNTTHKHAFAWKANDFASVLDGGAALTDTAGSIPSVTTLRLGGRVSDAALGGTVSRLRLYTRRLSATALQGKTAA